VKGICSVKVCQRYEPAVGEWLSADNHKNNPSKLQVGASDGAQHRSQVQRRWPGNVLRVGVPIAHEICAALVKADDLLPLGFFVRRIEKGSVIVGRPRSFGITYSNAGVCDFSEQLASSLSRPSPALNVAWDT
jgi:hypothetical protein